MYKLPDELHSGITLRTTVSIRRTAEGEQRRTRDPQSGPRPRTAETRRARADQYELTPSKRARCETGFRVIDYDLRKQDQGVSEAAARAGRLQLRIDNPKLRNMLCALDRNNDNQFDVTDVPRTEVGAWRSNPNRQAFIRSFVDTLARAGYTPRVVGSIDKHHRAMHSWKLGMQSLFDLYPSITKLDNTMSALTQEQYEGDSGDLVLTSATWEAHCTRSSPANMIRAIEKAYATTLRALFDTESNFHDSIERAIESDQSTHIAVQYPTQRTPSSIDRALRRMETRWMRSRSRLTQFERIKCGKWFGGYAEGLCNDSPKISLTALRLPKNNSLHFVHRGQAYRSYSRVYVPGDSGGSCFPADTLLQTADGNTITIGEIAELSAAIASGTAPARAMPYIASYDEDTQRIIYQQPLAVHVHADHYTPLLELTQEREQEVALRVTPNHALHVVRDGEAQWIPAGLLAPGDQYVRGNGTLSHYTDPSSTMEYGVHTVYNLSMTDGSTPGVPTYLVSGDGEHWVVAHNKSF